MSTQYSFVSNCDRRVLAVLRMLVKWGWLAAHSHQCMPVPFCTYVYAILDRKQLLQKQFLLSPPGWRLAYRPAA